MVGTNFVGTTASDDADNGGLRLAHAATEMWGRTDVIEAIAAQVSAIQPAAAAAEAVAISTPFGSMRVVSMSIRIEGKTQLIVASANRSSRRSLSGCCSAWALTSRLVD
jgi:hypothetical protein